MVDQHGQTILASLIQHRRIMEIEEKKSIILEKISHIDFHVSILNSNIESGYQNKDGEPSFSSLIQDLLSKKQELQKALDELL